MSYTTPPKFTGFQPSPPRQEIDFGVISTGFNLLIQHWKAYIVPGLVMLLAGIPYFIVSFLPLYSIFSGGPAPEPFQGIGLQLAFLAFQMLISLLVEPGIALYTLNVLRGRPATTHDLWLGFRDPLGYIALGALMMAAYVVGLLACCVGSIVATGLLMFAIPIKVDQNVTASEAMTRSWNMLKSQWLLATVFIFAVGLIATLGQVACYVGIAMTMPFYFIAPTILYLQYIGYEGVRTSDPISPYPRGGASYGQNIGEQPRQKPEGEPPPKPDDYL